MRIISSALFLAVKSVLKLELQTGKAVLRIVHVMHVINERYCGIEGEKVLQA